MATRRRMVGECVPPTLVSMPLKLLLFVLADGWTLVVGSLLGGLAVAG